MNRLLPWAVLLRAAVASAQSAEPPSEAGAATLSPDFEAPIAVGEEIDLGGDGYDDLALPWEAAAGEVDLVWSGEILSKVH